MPIAFAHLYQTLMFVASAFAKPEHPLTVPKLSEALSSFALPALSEAMAVEERAQEARQMVNSVQQVAARFGGKVEIKIGNSPPSTQNPQPSTPLHDLHVLHGQNPPPSTRNPT